MFDKLILDLELEDGIQTKEFGYVRFLKVSDLKKMKYRYEVFVQPLCFNSEVFGLDKKFPDFSLFFAKYESGEPIKVEDIFTGDKYPAIDVFINLLETLFEGEKITASTQYQVIVVGDKFAITIDNYEILRSILLKSLCLKRDEVRKGGHKSKDENMRKKFETYYQKRRQKQIREMKKNSIENIIRTVKVNLSLFNEKEKLREMTIYDLINSYRFPLAKENYERNYSALMAGADKKELDLTHWSQKIATTDL